MADPSHASVPFKFPRTPHLLNLGSATDDDLILDHSEAERWLARSVVIGERVGGWLAYLRLCNETFPRDAA